MAAIVSCCHHLIAHCDCSAVPSPIVLPLLPIAGAAVHCNRVAAVHCDCRCHPSCIASNCAASASAAIVRCPLCHPLSHHPSQLLCCPVAHCAAVIAHCCLGGAESIILSAPPTESMMLSVLGHACTLTLRANSCAGGAERVSYF